MSVNVGGRLRPKHFVFLFGERIGLEHGLGEHAQSQIDAHLPRVEHLLAHERLERLSTRRDHPTPALDGGRDDLTREQVTTRGAQLVHQLSRPRLARLARLH